MTRYMIRQLPGSASVAPSFEHMIQLPHDQLFVRQVGTTGPELGLLHAGRIALRLADRYPHLKGKLILASITAYNDYDNEPELWDVYRQRNNGQRRTSLSALLASPDLPAEETFAEWHTIARLSSQHLRPFTAAPSTRDAEYHRILR